MATTDALSANAQKSVLANLPAQHELNKQDAKKNAMWLGVSVVGYAAAAAILPAAIVTLPLIVAGTAAVLNGAKLLGNAARGLSLMGIKRHVADKDFVPKLKQKAGKALQRAPKLNSFSQKAFYVSLGALAATFVPVLAPVAALVYPLAVVGMLGSWAASDWAKGTAMGTAPTAKLVYQHQVAEGVIEPAEKILPPGVQAAGPQQQQKRGSILDLFRKKAANNNEKKAPEAKQAPKTIAPKP